MCLSIGRSSHERQGELLVTYNMTLLIFNKFLGLNVVGCCCLLHTLNKPRNCRRQREGET